MLRKLRWNSREPTDAASPHSCEDGAVADSAQASEEKQSNRLTFFDLPAELRNEIYDHVISDTTLSLPSNIFASSRRSRLPLMRRKSVAPQINGLLLASRQCHREYLSLLLSTVSVIVEVNDFDFAPIMRVSSGLGELESQALRSNRNLVLHLNTRNCTAKDMNSLRRWLDFRKTETLGLPWKYEFPIDKLLPPNSMGKVRLCRELEYYADTISALAVDVEAEQQQELRAIIDAFESKAMWLEDDLGWLGQRSKSVSRNVRGLAGGGLR